MVGGIDVGCRLKRIPLPFCFRAKSTGWPGSLGPHVHVFPTRESTVARTQGRGARHDVSWVMFSRHKMGRYYLSLSNKKCLFFCCKAFCYDVWCATSCDSRRGRERRNVHVFGLNLCLLPTGWHPERAIPEDWRHQAQHSHWGPLWKLSRYCQSSFLTLTLVPVFVKWLHFLKHAEHSIRSKMAVNNCNRTYKSELSWEMGLSEQKMILEGKAHRGGIGRICTCKTMFATVSLTFLNAQWPHFLLYLLSEDIGLVFQVYLLEWRNCVPPKNYSTSLPKVLQLHAVYCPVLCD